MFWQTEARRLGGCPGRSFAVALVVALLVSGCSSESGDSDEQAADQPSASQASTEAETSTKKSGENPEPSAPTLPPKARGNSLKAAEAFVEHYIDLFNYAMTTGDTKAFRAASTGCEGCDRYATSSRSNIGAEDRIKAKVGPLAIYLLHEIKAGLLR